MKNKKYIIIFHGSNEFLYVKNIFLDTISFTSFFILYKCLNIATNLTFPSREILKHITYFPILQNKIEIEILKNSTQISKTIC